MYIEVEKELKELERFLGLTLEELNYVEGVLMDVYDRGLEFGEESDSRFGRGYDEGFKDGYKKGIKASDNDEEEF